jgi:hypothetical protein
LKGRTKWKILMMKKQIEWKTLGGKKQSKKKQETKKFKPKTKWKWKEIPQLKMSIYGLFYLKTYKSLKWVRKKMKPSQMKMRKLNFKKGRNSPIYSSM